MDPDGKERTRLEGYLPRDEFRAHLEMGLARVALAQKDWKQAESRFSAVAENYPDSNYAPQAIYFGGVSRYSVSHESADLKATAATLADKYPDTEWRTRSLPWD